MKFMVFTSPTEHALKHPPTALAYEAQIDRIREALSDGSIETVYHGEGRAMFVVNAASPQEVEAFFQSIPLGDQMRRTIEPLEDFFAHATRIHGYLSANAAE